jgi:hypothetical protein
VTNTLAYYKVFQIGQKVLFHRTKAASGRFREEEKKEEEEKERKKERESNLNFEF